jgi:hypothetical protein
MPKQRQKQAPLGGGVGRPRNTPSQGHREPPQRGTTRRAGHSAYARYPHQLFAADRAAETAKTRTGQRAPK